MKRFSTNQWLFVLGAVILVGFGASAPVVAKSFAQAAEDLSSIPADTVVDGAAFVAGDTVSVDGTVKGDLFCAGNTVTVNGTVEGDVLCAGNTVTIAGTVSGDVRVAGNTVTLKGAVKGSVSAAGSSLVADSSLTIGSDLTAGASSVSLAGTVGRDVRVGASNVQVSGTVGRHVDGAIETLSIASGAKIGGDLTYTSERDGSIAAGTVAGSVRREQPTNSTNVMQQNAFTSIMLFLFFMVVLFVVFALFIVLIVPRYVRTATARYTSAQSLLKAAAVGIATFFVVVPVAMVAFLSGIGAFVGLFILSAYFLVIMLSGVVVAYRLGMFMVGGRTANMFATVGIGAITLAVLTIVPFIGLLVGIVTGILGLGMVMLSFGSQYEGDRPYSGGVPTVVAKKTTPAKNTKS